MRNRSRLLLLILLGANVDPTLIVLIYKLVTIAAATFIIWLGYRLFTLGVFKSSGDIDATIRDNRIILKRAAPGTFFVLFGATIFVVIVWRGMQTAQNQTSLPKTEASKEGPIASIVSVSGAGGFDRERALMLAQAVNTIAQASTVSTDPARRTAISMLKEWRKTELAEKYLSSADVDLYLQVGENVAQLGEKDRKRYEAVHEWLAVGLQK
jgi:hypothetical protein